MSFRDNLLHLRASRNMTQEQLAMMLGVSRQSVTKWEAEKSSPEMDKLLKLCQIFDCTLDDLVQGDLTGRPAPESDGNAAPPPTAPADVFDYDTFMRRFANKISGGVFTILVGVAISYLFFIASDPSAHPLFILPENVSAAVGCICIFAAIACALALFIPAGMEHSQFMRNHPYLEDFYTADQKAQARSAFTWQLIGGIVLIFFGICVALLLDGTNLEESTGAAAVLCGVAIGAPLIVRGGMTLSRVNIANYNMAAGEVLEARELAQAPIPPELKQDMLATKRSDDRIGALCGVIMIVATIAGLVMLFVPGYQNELFWLAWPIGGLLCGITALLIKGFSKNETS